MSGIAACLEANRSVLSALGEGLTARGADQVLWHERGIGLVARAGLPSVHGVEGLKAVADGVVETGTLMARYLDDGGAALLGSPHPFAMILADPVRRSLSLVRNGDGPTLYYAVTEDGTVLAGSEPAALLAAGVPAAPDREVLGRFLDTGLCDESEATFFAGIRRVLPNQVVEARSGRVTVTASRSLQGTAYAPVPVALRWAARGERVGVRFAQGLPGAALVGAAVSAQAEYAADLDAPLAAVPVYSAAYAGDDEQDYVARVLAELEPRAYLHRTLPFDAVSFAAGIADFVRDLGEPMPDASSFTLWASARAAAGEVDVLLDAAGAERLLSTEDARAVRPGHLSRLVDRVSARFGVSVRTPYPDVAGAGESLRCELGAFVRATLPDPAPRLADELREAVPLLPLLTTAREHVYRVFTSPAFAARPWVNQRRVLRQFQALLNGRGAEDPAYFWRLYVVELWLRAHHPAVALPRQRLPRSRTVRGGVTWQRHPVKTRWFGPDDGTAGFVDAVAWYVGELMDGDGPGRRVPDGAKQPWYALVSARAAAVAQGRCTPMWEIRPGRLARLAANLTSADEWCAQVAIKDVGRGRVLRATIAGACGRLLRRPQWFDRTLGSIAVRALRGPAEGAPAPLDVGVLAPPRQPGRLSAQLEQEIRAKLSGSVRDNFGGVYLLTGSGAVLGRSVADRSCAPGEDVITTLLADDPLGARDAATPLCIVVQERQSAR
ncbi:hypothetical protein Afil01_11830 [Actinorhabdospora filicis]|uniref:Asparagine synthetase domain-containing protein n=1 Tax=Actinorhabdospora filicis TaxID=1785913 RepID=A0A9W6SKP4_9ACTN|nr:hypothetical protein [Actinorhabdospora filicis]GLZ76376.1 hypothetical protein Afil01_11830 [Actinorhabdospora filicis]